MQRRDAKLRQQNKSKWMFVFLFILNFSSFFFFEVFVSKRKNEFLGKIKDKSAQKKIIN